MSKKNGSDRVHILELRAKNVKSIRLVELNAVGDVLEIRGDSGQGKSSILDAIEAAFRGMDASMIRKGENAAEIELKLSEATINRIVRADGNDTEIVTGKDGKRVVRAKEFLRTICDTNVFRPIQWVELSGGDAAGQTERRRKQRDQLLAALPMTLEASVVVQKVADLGDEYLALLEEINLADVQFDAHALTVCGELMRLAYDYRKGENAKADEAENELKLRPAPEKAAPREDVATLEIMERNARDAYVRAKASIENSENREKRIRELREAVANSTAPLRTDVEEAILHYRALEQSLSEEIAQLESQLTDKRKKLSEVAGKCNQGDVLMRQVEAHEARVSDLAAAEKEIAGGPQQFNLGELEAAIIQAVANKEARRAQDAHNAAAEKAKTARERSEQLDKLVKLFRDELPKQLINGADLPVQNLTVDENQIFIGGIPIHQLGTSEQIRVGVAIAAALNPKAGFVLVDKAESLGKKDRLALAAVAKEMDLQLILTYVDADAEPRDGVVVMREGEAVAASV